MAIINPLTASLIAEELAGEGVIKRNDQASEELLMYLFEKPMEEWPDEVMAKLEPFLPDRREE
jgi:hypothetical protein